MAGMNAHVLCDGTRIIFGNTICQNDSKHSQSPVVMVGLSMKPEMPIPVHLGIPGLTVNSYHPFKPDPASAVEVLQQLYYEGKTVTSLSSNLIHIIVYQLYAEKYPSVDHKRRVSFQQYSVTQTTALTMIFKASNGGYQKWLTLPVHGTARTSTKKPRNRSNSVLLCSHPQHDLLPHYCGGKKEGLIPNAWGTVLYARPMCVACYTAEKTMMPQLYGVHPVKEVMHKTIKDYREKLQKKLDMYDRLVLVASCNSSMPVMCIRSKAKMQEHGSCILMFFASYPHMWSDHSIAFSVNKLDMATSFARYIICSKGKRMVHKRSTMIANTFEMVRKIRQELYLHGCAATCREPSTMKGIKSREIMPLIKVAKPTLDEVKLSPFCLFMFWQGTCYTRAFICMVNALQDESLDLRVTLMPSTLAGKEWRDDETKYTPLRLPPAAQSVVEVFRGERMTWEYLFYLVFTLKCKNIIIVGSYTNALIGLYEKIGYEEHLHTGAVFAFLTEKCPHWCNLALEKSNIYGNLQAYVHEENAAEIAELRVHENEAMGHDGHPAMRNSVVNHAEQLGLIDVEYDRDVLYRKVDNATLAELGKIDILPHDELWDNRLLKSLVKKELFTTRV